MGFIEDCVNINSYWFKFLGKLRILIVVLCKYFVFLLNDKWFLKLCGGFCLINVLKIYLV